MGTDELLHFRHQAPMAIFQLDYASGLLTLAAQVGKAGDTLVLDGDDRLRGTPGPDARNARMEVLW